MAGDPPLVPTYPVDPRRGFHRILPIDAFEHLPPLREVERAILKL